jgi:PIN domain nuclease of toxin-antitoxin system
LRVLLDTQCWLWLQVSPERLSPAALKVAESSDNELLFSAASSWEIAIKNALGRLPLPAPPADYVPERMRSSGVVALPISHAHALQVASLPHHHRDPFDRLLIAQAQVERVPILTADPVFDRYEVTVRSAN